MTIDHVIFSQTPIQTTRHRIRLIIAMEAAKHNCTYADVMSGSVARGGSHYVRGGQRKRIVQARWAAMRVIRDEFKLSTPQIGRIFGRDHTSVQYALGMLGRKKRCPYTPVAQEPNDSGADHGA